MVAAFCQMKLQTNSTEAESHTIEEKEGICNPCPPAPKLTGTCSCCCIVHVLRCTECGFETVVRDRFDTHHPCAGKLKNYQLYSCSQCGACSTSQTIMNEHGELCHSDRSFHIKESLEPFKPTSEVSSSNTGSVHSLASCSRPEGNQSISSETASFLPHIGRSDQHKINPCNINTEQQRKSVDPGIVGNAWTSLMEFVNQFGPEKLGNFTAVGMSPDKLNCNWRPFPINFICPLCPQATVTSMEEFVRHLALVHLLPVPSILNCLSPFMLSNNLSRNRHQQQQPPYNGFPEKEIRTMNSHPRLQTEQRISPTPTAKSESRSAHNNLKREHVSLTQANAKATKFLDSPDDLQPIPFSKVSCPYCSKELQNVYHLQLHILYDHSIEFSKMINPGHAFSAEHLSGSLAMQSMSSTERSPQDLSRGIRFFTKDHPTMDKEATETTQLSGQLQFGQVESSFRNTETNRITSRIVHCSDSSQGFADFQVTTAAAAAALGIPFNSEFAASFYGLNSTTKEQTSASDLMGSHTGQPDGIPLCSQVKRPRLQTDAVTIDTEAPCRLRNTCALPNSLITGPLISADRNKNPLSSTEIPRPLNSQMTDPNFPLLFTECLQQLQLQLPPNFSISNATSLPETPTLTTPCTNEVRSGSRNTVDGSNTLNHLSWHNSCQIQKREDNHISEVEVSATQNYESSLSGNTSVKQSSQTGLNAEISNPQNGLVHNTLRKTRSDMKVIHRYLVQVKQDNRDIHQIPYYELDQYIQDFVMTAKKKDGHEYEPESLKAFVHSLERHLKHHDYPHSVLKGSAFTGTRAVLNQRLNELRALSRSGTSNTGNSGSVSSGSRRLTETCGKEYGFEGTSKRSSAGKLSTIAGLIHTGMLGKTNPQAILNSLWLINRTQFNIGGTQRHRNLVWGQFQLFTDETGMKVLKFTPLFESAEVRYCRGYGGSRGCDSTMRSTSANQQLGCTGSTKKQPLPFNCVELFEIYANLRPADARGVSEPFYLCPDSTWKESGTWFKSNAAGSQLLSRIPRLLGLKPLRETNQPVVSAVDGHREHDLGKGEKSHEKPNPFLLNSPTSDYLGRSLFDSQKSVCPPHIVGPNIPVPHPLFVPGLLNYIPFIFPPNPKTSFSPTQHLNVSPASTMYPDGLYGSSVNVPLSEPKHEFPTNQHLKPRDEQHEADDLSRQPEQCCRQTHNKRIDSPRSHDQSPPLILDRYAPIPSSSDGTHSPTDAENLSLFDTPPRSSFMPTDLAHLKKSLTQSTTETAQFETDCAHGENSHVSNSSPDSSRSQSVTVSRQSLINTSDQPFTKQNKSENFLSKLAEQDSEPVNDRILNLAQNKSDDSGLA